MARPIREKSGTGIYHVMLRGINRQDIFENDEDYQQISPVEGYGQILDIDTDDTKHVSDSDVKAFLLKSKGIANPLIIQSLEKTRKNDVLVSALSIGAGIRQLSRITGVSFGVIQKLQK
jgi:hypothetical protein